jgi:NAD-dependent deacetylase
LLSHTFFETHTDLFFRYYKECLIIPNVKPNAAHFALAKLEEIGKLTAVITQNIDGLHTLAGSKTVYELHGSNYRHYCKDCGEKYSLEYITSEENCDGFVPKCKKCGGIVRPDVVLYEEALDDDTVTKAIHAIGKADCMIVGGTSLAVYPAAGLLRYFEGSNLVLINKTATPYDSHANLVIHKPIGEVLGSIV